MEDNAQEQSNEISNNDIALSRETLKERNIDTLQLYSQAKDRVLQFSSSSYSLLDELITQIHHEGNLGDVQIVMEKVDNTINRYCNDTWRRVFLPAPLMLIASIEGRFKKKANISKLLKAFDYEELDIKLSIGLYIFRMVFFLVTLINTLNSFIYQQWLLLCFIPIFALILWCDLEFSKKVINQTAFVPLYKRIRDALLRRIQAQEEL